MEELSVGTIAEELHRLNENISYLTDMLERKFGGYDESNLHVTLHADKPIQVTNKESEEKE